MREAMLICAKNNVQFRQRKGKLWVSKPGAKRGYLCTAEQAKAIAPHGERMHLVADSLGLKPVK